MLQHTRTCTDTHVHTHTHTHAHVLTCKGLDLFVKIRIIVDLLHERIRRCMPLVDAQPLSEQRHFKLLSSPCSSPLCRTMDVAQVQVQQC